MKKFTLVLLFSIFSLHNYATIWTVLAGSNNAFNNSSLSVALGDTVVFNIGIDHNALEVSQSTWNANGTTPLPGGFNVDFGGGSVLPPQLQVGMHYYVCTAHIDNGMKGTINVTPSGVPNISPSQVNLKVFPNPFVDKMHVQYHLDQRSDVQIKITDMLGKTVVVLRDETQMPGDYLHTYNQLSLIAGSRYFLDVVINGKRIVQKLTVE